MPDPMSPLAPEAILTLTDKGRGLYENLVRRVQDPRDDPELPGLDPDYLLKPGTSLLDCLSALGFKICATSIL